MGILSMTSAQHLNRAIERTNQARIMLSNGLTRTALVAKELARQELLRAKWVRGATCL